MTEFPGKYWSDYELIDSGGEEKLERFGKYVLARPEPKALWDKNLSEKEWTRLTHTVFVPGAGFGRVGKEDSGSWRRVKTMEDQWYVDYRSPQGFSMKLRLGMTAFKHVGIFPEQAPNWEYIYSKTSGLSSSSSGLDSKTSRLEQGSNAKPKVLNLFAYTGAASLCAKAAGADVTHLDSVRQVVTWARGNMEKSSLDGIRWIVEDAMKFVHREAKRGNTYDGIILDPPAYGHGPHGEKWKLDENLFEMLKTVVSLLKDEKFFLVLNLYSNGYTPQLADTIVRQAFSSSSKEVEKLKIESGELALLDNFGKILPLSTVVRVHVK